MEPGQGKAIQISCSRHTSPSGSSNTCLMWSDLLFIMCPASTAMKPPRPSRKATTSWQRHHCQQPSKGTGLLAAWVTEAKSACSMEAQVVYPPQFVDSNYLQSLGDWASDGAFTSLPASVPWPQLTNQIQSTPVQKIRDPKAKARAQSCHSCQGEEGTAIKSSERPGTASSQTYPQALNQQALAITGVRNDQIFHNFDWNARRELSQRPKQWYRMLGRHFLYPTWYVVPAVCSLAGRFCLSLSFVLSWPSRERQGTTPCLFCNRPLLPGGRAFICIGLRKIMSKGQRSRHNCAVAAWKVRFATPHPCLPGFRCILSGVLIWSMVCTADAFCHRNAQPLYVEGSSQIVMQEVIPYGNAARSHCSRGEHLWISLCAPDASSRHSQPPRARSNTPTAQQIFCMNVLGAPAEGKSFLGLETLHCSHLADKCPHTGQWCIGPGAVRQGGSGGFFQRSSLSPRSPDKGAHGAIW